MSVYPSVLCFCGFYVHGFIQYGVWFGNGLIGIRGAQLRLQSSQSSNTTLVEDGLSFRSPEDQSMQCFKKPSLWDNTRASPRKHRVSIDLKTELHQILAAY